MKKAKRSFLKYFATTILFLSSNCSNSPNILLTIAGTGFNGFTPDGESIYYSEVNRPNGIFIDDSDNLYFTEENMVRKIDRNGIVTTVVGSKEKGFSGDGGPAVKALLDSPDAVYADNKGNIYISDTDNQRIRKVDSKGIISTFAGTGERYSFITPEDKNIGDNGPATLAKTSSPQGIVGDKAGNIFISDYAHNSIRKIDKNGIITTVAGCGPDSDSGCTGKDNISAKKADMAPTSLFLDENENIYFSDVGYHKVRKIDKNGIITTVAGNGSDNYFEKYKEGERATLATLRFPDGITMDKNGNLYIGISGGVSFISKVDPQGIITTMAGNREINLNGGHDNENGKQPQQVTLVTAGGLTIDKSGNIYFTDGNRIRKILNCSLINCDLPEYKKNQVIIPPVLRAALKNPEKVSELDLKGSISGDISILPPEIGKLYNLEKLDLSSNKLTELPKEIGKLTKLKSLLLGSQYNYNNQLFRIPPEIANLKDLEVLDFDGALFGKDFSGAVPNNISVPDAIYSLTKLKRLNLSDNYINKISDKIGNLTNLEQLDLHSNKFIQIPNEIGKLKKLKVLNLSYAKLESVPSEIGNLNNLEVLDLTQNMLTSLPPAIGSLVKLNRFELNQNKLTKLPDEISNLNNLTKLTLGSNELEDLPANFNNLSNLKQLNLGSNKLNKIPGQIFYLKLLEKLDLSINNISSVQEELTGLENLKYLDLDSNKLSELPVNIFYLKNLVLLDLMNNNFPESLEERIDKLFPEAHTHIRFKYPEITSPNGESDYQDSWNMWSSVNEGN